MATVSLFHGDWAKVSGMLAVMSSTKLSTVLRPRLDKLGRALKKKIKKHIKDKDLGWVPLSHVTIEAKGHEKVYVETKDYQRKINHKIFSKGTGDITLLVTVSGMHEPSGLPMKKLAGYLEYGTSKIPSRPLWRPTYYGMDSMPEYQALLDAATIMGLGLRR